MPPSRTPSPPDPDHPLLYRALALPLSTSTLSSLALDVLKIVKEKRIFYSVKTGETRNLTVVSLSNNGDAIHFKAGGPFHHYLASTSVQLEPFMVTDAELSSNMVPSKTDILLRMIAALVEYAEILLKERAAAVAEGRPMTLCLNLSNKSQQPEGVKTAWTVPLGGVPELSHALADLYFRLPLPRRRPSVNWLALTEDAWAAAPSAPIRFGGQEVRLVIGRPTSEAYRRRLGRSLHTIVQAVVDNTPIDDKTVRELMPDQTGDLPKFRPNARAKAALEAFDLTSTPSTNNSPAVDDDGDDTRPAKRQKRKVRNNIHTLARGHVNPKHASA